jgi:hypothetical protein
LRFGMQCAARRRGSSARARAVANSRRRRQLDGLPLRRDGHGAGMVSMANMVGRPVSCGLRRGRTAGICFTLIGHLFSRIGRRKDGKDWCAGPRRRYQSRSIALAQRASFGPKSSRRGSDAKQDYRTALTLISSRPSRLTSLTHASMPVPGSLHTFFRAIEQVAVVRCE